MEREIMSLNAVAEPILMRAKMQDMVVVTAIDQSGTDVRGSTPVWGRHIGLERDVGVTLTSAKQGVPAGGIIVRARPINIATTYNTGKHSD
jgi:hypothetical protein